MMWSEDKTGLRPVKTGLGLTSCGLSLGLAVLVLFCETRSCHARRHNDLGGQQLFKYYVWFFLGSTP